MSNLTGMLEVAEAFQHLTTAFIDTAKKNAEMADESETRNRELEGKCLELEKNNLDLIREKEDLAKKVVDQQSEIENLKQEMVRVVQDHSKEIENLCRKQQTVVGKQVNLLNQFVETIYPKDDTLIESSEIVPAIMNNNQVGNADIPNLSIEQDRQEEDIECVDIASSSDESDSDLGYEVLAPGHEIVRQEPRNSDNSVGERSATQKKLKRRHLVNSDCGVNGLYFNRTTKKKYYLCKCSRKFESVFELGGHLYGQKPCRCGANFENSAERIEHLKGCQRKWFCRLCGSKSQTNFDELMSHMRNVHGKFKLTTMHPTQTSDR